MLDVSVEKGMQHGQKIVFEGQADEAVSEVKLFTFKMFSVLLYRIELIFLCLSTGTVRRGSNVAF